LDKDALLYALFMAIYTVAIIFGGSLVVLSFLALQFLPLLLGLAAVSIAYYGILTLNKEYWRERDGKKEYA